jgi:hypothetical protein
MWASYQARCHLYFTNQISQSIHAVEANGIQTRATDTRLVKVVQLILVLGHSLLRELLFAEVTPRRVRCVSFHVIVTKKSHPLCGLFGRMDATDFRFFFFTILCVYLDPLI